jgi:hypothetical protein
MDKKYLDVGMPDKMDVSHKGSYLEITRRWIGAKVFFMVPFTIFWCGFLVFWYSKAMDIENLTFRLFPLLHVGVGIWLLYSTTAGLINKTTVRVGFERITVRHGPVPYFGKTISAMDIKQLYSKEKTSYSSRQRSVSYEIHAMTQAGKNVKLVTRLESSEQALFIEQEIEKYLGIKDRPVRGEIPR